MALDLDTQIESEVPQITEEIPAVEQAPAETPAVETSGEQEEGAVEQSGIDEELAELARHYDIDVADWPDQEKLRKQVVALERRHAEYGRRLGQGQAPQEQTPAPAQQPPQPAGSLNLDELLPEKDYDENIRKAFKGTLDHVESVFAAKQKALEESYQQQFGAMQQFMQVQEARETARINQELDGFFTGLGKEYEPLFGKGSVTETKGPQLLARQELVQEAQAIQAADDSMGRPRQSWQSLMKRAHAVKYADQQQTFARKQVANQLAERKNGALSKPAAKKGKPLPTDLLIKQRAEAWDRKHLGE